jgi:hypothetical protein
MGEQRKNFPKSVSQGINGCVQTHPYQTTLIPLGLFTD